MHVHPLDALAQPRVAEAHALVDDRVHLVQREARLAAHDRAREVAEVAGLLGAREDVHHHRRVRADRAVALLVRVHRLVARRADRVRGQVAVGHHPRVDGRAQVLGRELPAVAPQPALADAAGRAGPRCPPRGPPRRRAATARSRAPRGALRSRAPARTGRGRGRGGSRARRAPSRGRAGSSAAPRRAAGRGCAGRARSRRRRAALACRPSRAATRPSTRTARGRPCAWLFARSISRSLITRMRVFPFWTNRNGSGAKNPVGIEDVGVGLGGGVEQTGGGRLLHGA